jgi:succinylglutamate desuccinylase
MSSAARVLAGETPRLLGRLGGSAPGPLLVAVGGLHGNEPSGVIAIRRVLERLAELRLPLGGELVALCGNRAALAAGRRFVERDLNRLWTADEVAALRAADPAADGAERREQRELLEVLDPLLGPRDAAAERRVFLLDLHSTSGGGPPFSIAGETEGDQRFARSLRVPTILGLKENVRGTLLEYFTSHGHVGLVLEGGQSREPATTRHHEAALWLGLVAAGVLEAAPEIALGPHVELLDLVSRGLPRAVRIRRRYRIEDGEEFRMEPGFASFQRVRRGQLLARSNNGREHEVRAPMDSVLLMPRYQGQGDDGFFLGYELPRS